MSTTEELEVIHRHRATQIVRRAAWLHFKLALGAWAVAFMLVPPVVTIEAVNNVVWLMVCLTGSIVSATGLILGFWTKRRRASIIVELAGILLMIVGPVVYWTTQLSILNSGDPEAFQGRFALSFYAYAMVAAVLARLATVFPRFSLKQRRLVIVGK